MTWLIAFIAKSALMSSPIGGFLKMIPKGVWKFIGIAALIGALFWAHQHIAHKALKKADAAGYARAKDEDAKALAKAHKDALNWKAQADSYHAKLSQSIKEKTDAENARIDRHAAIILRDGPGKASCGQSDYPQLPAATGGRETRPGAPPVAVDRVSDPRGLTLIGLPFSAAISAARQCDMNLQEVLSWRESDTKHRQAWPSH